MHFLKKIFFIRPCLGVLQTGEGFFQARSHFILPKVTGTRGIIGGGDEIGRRCVNSPLACVILFCQKLLVHVVLSGGGG